MTMSPVEHPAIPDAVLLSSEFDLLGMPFCLTHEELARCLQIEASGDETSLFKHLDTLKAAEPQQAALAAFAIAANGVGHNKAYYLKRLMSYTRGIWGDELTARAICRNWDRIYDRSNTARLIGETGLLSDDLVYLLFWHCMSSAFVRKAIVLHLVGSAKARNSVKLAQYLVQRLDGFRDFPREYLEAIRVRMREVGIAPEGYAEGVADHQQSPPPSPPPVRDGG